MKRRVRREQRVRLSAERKRDADDGAAGRPARDLEASRFAVEMREPLARVAESGAVANHSASESHAVVVELERHGFLMDAHAKLQPSTRLRRLDPVLQRIL